MIEIVVIINVTRALAAKATARGASAWWAALGPLLWFGGELSAFFVAGAMGYEGLGIYPFALAYGALGAGLAYLVVLRVPTRVIT